MGPIEGKSRIIFHVDMDAFFVSVEELFDPGLKGKAVIVGGMPDQRGVVSAASYEARRFGVHAAMPLVTAQKLCPQAIFLAGRRETYADYSKKVRGILETYSPVVEMVSIDEAYLDFTGSQRLYGHPQLLANRIRQQLKQETGLSASIGVAATKLVSKVASDMAKPSGILYVFPGYEATFLGTLRVGKLPGVGEVTERRLRELGILRVAQLTELGREALSEIFGNWGDSLYLKSVGLDTPHFEFHEEPQSISHEHTFYKDTRNLEELQKTIATLVQKTAHRLREHRLYAKRVTLKIRDRGFKTRTRAFSLEESTQLDDEILHAVLQLLQQHWDTSTEVRLLGVALTSLEFGAGQEALFTQKHRDKRLRLYQAADKVRHRFGFNAITSARTTK
jgi:DNA polymerase-4